MVGVMTDPTDASTFTELASYQPTSTAYTYYSIPLSLYTGNGTYIAIKMPAASSEVLYRGVCIDDVSVTENPCLAPTDLTVTDITASSAPLDWTGDQASYNVRYKVSGDFFDGFENGLIGWTTIRNGEGTSNTDWIWMNSTSSYSHNGNCFVQSRSWYDNVSYSVDNWLITPRVTLEGTLSFWVRGDGNYPDKYYVCVSTTQPAIDAFEVLGDARYPTGEWAEVIVDLSAYAGQQGYIAIRHQDSDKDYLWIDDFGISIGSEWLELNGVTNPVTIQNLIPGTTYEWQVQGCDCNGVGSLTEWSGVHSFITSLCSPEDQCELTFVLTDSYGDGWNGAAINVVDVESGLSLGLMSNQNLDGTTGEETQTVTLPVCDGRELRFEWVSGNWDSECSYVVTDINGNEVFSGSSAMTEPFTYTVSCDAVQVQTVALTAGLNWFSTGTEITLEDLQAALVATGNTSIMIASQSDGKTTYANGRWRGQLSTLDVKQMYKITVGTACEIALEGAPVNPAEHPVTIHNGSNWIGFPLGTSMTLTDAFVGFAVNGDMVVSQSNGSATYTGGRWRGSLTTLEPGQGYNYKSASSTTKVLWFGLGHACVDLGLPSGLLWATCNVGANAPEEYGDYFAWGETQPKDNYSYGTYQHCIGSRMTKYCNNSNFGYNGFTDNLTTLEPSDDAATANWGNGWRMPTQAEWQELVDNTTITWTTQNGVNGWLFTSSNSNSLFLPAAGCRSNSSLYYAGSESYYWSSSLYTDYPDKAWAFYYYDENYVDFLSREEGASVRPVRSVRN